MGYAGRSPTRTPPQIGEGGERAALLRAQDISCPVLLTRHAISRWVLLPFSLNVEGSRIPALSAAFPFAASGAAPGLMGQGASLWLTRWTVEQKKQI